MFFHTEKAGLPRVHRVAFGALALSRAGLKLTFVRIGIVAIRAFLEGERFPEISSRMAIRATNLDVRPEKRKFRLRMVELSRHADMFPTARIMAGFAGALKFSLVRIGVAIDAAVKLQPCEFDGVIRPARHVALFARHFYVQPGEWIFCFGMIELRSLFPIHEVVAPLALRPQVSFVYILVAGEAVLRQSQV